MKKLDFIKVKNICPLEVTISKIKILWLEYFQIVYLYPEYIKNFQNSIIRKMTQVFLNTKRFEQTLHQYIYMEKGMATHSNILAWRIPRTEKPVGLQSVGSQRVGHNYGLHFLSFFWLSAWIDQGGLTDRADNLMRVLENR